jgi:hypothetical protein
MLGWDTVERILTEYYRAYAFKHPGPRDFFATASTVSGRDLSSFFDAMAGHATRFDYAVARVERQPIASGAIDSVVLIRRMGDGVFPLDVRVTFSDGAAVVEHWDGASPWHALRYRRAADVTAVDVDPDGLLLLDVNTTNNSWRRDAHGTAAAFKWATRWLTWAQHLLLTYAFFS